MGTDNGSSAFTGRITGSGDMTKFGTSTPWLSGNNLHTSVPAVREDTLVVQGDQISSAVTLQVGPG